MLAADRLQTTQLSGLAHSTQLSVRTAVALARLCATVVSKPTAGAARMPSEDRIMQS